MSVQTSASRPTGKSVGAATVGLLVTLVAFVGVLLAFVVAPLLLLGLALVAYLVVRPRARRDASTGPGAASGGSRHRFGSGAS